MTTNPTSTNPAPAGAGDPRPLTVDPTGQDPGATDPAAAEKVRLQVAIFEVTKESGGKSQQQIRDMLLSAFARHGVQSPPGTWLDSVASAAFYGEPYIIDIPAALAAEGTVPAPNEDVRERLASRRRLRKEKLPPGILPAPTDWDVPDNQVTHATTGRRRRVSRECGNRWAENRLDGGGVRRGRPRGRGRHGSPGVQPARGNQDRAPVAEWYGQEGQRWQISVITHSWGTCTRQPWSGPAGRSIGCACRTLTPRPVSPPCWTAPRPGGGCSPRPGRGNARAGATVPEP